MPLYRYQALSVEGKTFSSTIEAESLFDAKQKLSRQKVIAIQITALSDREIQKNLSQKEVFCLTREVARLLRAGLPLFETLSALEEKYRSLRPHRMLLDFCEQIKAGYPFSQALQRHSKTFDVFYIAMVANAEKTGQLAACLENLELLIGRQMKMRKQIISALLYPALLSIFCSVIFFSLLFFVIPSLQELFEGRDSLHPLTKMVFTVSRFACEFQGVLGALAFLALAFGIVPCIVSSWRQRALAVFLRLPGARAFFAKIALVRFARAASALLEGGLPLLSAFARARTVMRHLVLQDVIAKAEERISQGESISQPFLHHPLIPPLVPRMLSLAEQGGNLSFTLEQIAQMYEEEVESGLTRFAELAQPILLLVLGGLVGFVLLSVLLPLTDVSGF